MRQATLHIHGPANDLLAPNRRNRPFSVGFELPSGLRDVVQSAGVPHVEIGDLHVNGDPATWSARVDEGDSIEAWSRYPLSTPPERPAFVLDVHLGRLAHYLRLFGFDTAHRPHAADPELVEQSIEQRRTLLTRDRGLLMRSMLRDGSFVRATDPHDQIIEVVERFALAQLTTPFTRCLACNGTLRPLEATEASRQVPAAIAETHTDFTTCPDCGRVYWKGSHYQRLLAIIEQVGAHA